MCVDGAKFYWEGDQSKGIKKIGPSWTNFFSGSFYMEPKKKIQKIDEELRDQINT